jgi:hypothetical protein
MLSALTSTNMLRSSSEPPESGIPPKTSTPA